MPSTHDTIAVRGARTHNLQNVDVDLPRDKLTVITGLSGSGKSSLAFNTLYAEGQRRYVESLSAYARQFLSTMDKPEVDHIEGLSPAISIEQKSTSHNPRSTVGTITEIYDYLRLLFARVGEARCPTHGHVLSAQSTGEIVDQVLALPENSRVAILAPIVRDQKGTHEHVFAELTANGYIRARIDGIVVDLDNTPELEKNKKHTIEVVIDRLVLRPEQKQRLAESFETALELGDGKALLSSIDDANDLPEMLFSNRYACPDCGYSLSELEPRMFSFNSPHGACQSCDGLGVVENFAPDLIVHDGALSIAEGAVRGMDRSHVYYFHLLSCLAKHYKFSVDVPYETLPSNIQHKILYGSGDEKIDFSWKHPQGFVVKRVNAWEGVIQQLRRRLNSTSSMGVREEITRRYMTVTPCDVCNGSRLREESRNVFLGKQAISDITSYSIESAVKYFNSVNLTGQKGIIASKVLTDIKARLKFLDDVGLNYLTLDRSAGSLSGGEAQRIRLASQIGAGLVGVMYILDEPSIGLHQRDNSRLLNTLKHLRDIGNTVLVVEHDEEAIRTADHIVDIGPGAGVHGGKIVAQGNVRKIEREPESITGQYLSRKRKIEVPESRHTIDPNKLVHIKGASGNNLKSIEVEIPVGLFTCVTGVSGSGKSTLVNQTIYPIAAKSLNNMRNITIQPYRQIQGLDHLDKVVDIDQSPIGRTPRSNPATYTGMFTPIRELFAKTQEARTRGYKPGRFSFNVKGGRCEACQGDGLIRVEMHFLPDVYVKCDTCDGMRYNRETLEVQYKGKNIHQVLNMTVEEGFDFFSAIPSIRSKLATLMDVGLSYIQLGQSATTLSGGEAQRVKLSKELSKRSTGKTLYILDEPTTGLHFLDIQHLLNVLTRLRDGGNTVIVIEHNLDVIKTADWIIDMGPEGGAKGGEIVAVGTPEEVADEPRSYTGQYLRNALGYSGLAEAAG